MVTQKHDKETTNRQALIRYGLFQYCDIFSAKKIKLDNEI